MAESLHHSVHDRLESFLLRVRVLESRGDHSPENIFIVSQSYFAALYFYADRRQRPLLLPLLPFFYDTRIKLLGLQCRCNARGTSRISHESELIRIEF